MTMTFSTFRLPKRYVLPVAETLREVTVGPIGSHPIILLIWASLLITTNQEQSAMIKSLSNRSRVAMGDV